jgi:hypothetical protein
VIGAHIRDVIGLSPNDREAMRRWAAWWWRMNRGLVINQAATTRKRLTGPALRVTAEPTPRRNRREYLPAGTYTATDFDGRNRRVQGRNYFAFTSGVDTTFRNLPPMTPPPGASPRPVRPAPLAPVPIVIRPDTRLPKRIVARLPKSLAAARTLRDLLRTAAGRAWWRDVGMRLMHERGAG